MKPALIKKTIVFFLILVWHISLKSQTLTVNELITGPSINTDQTDDLLQGKGWEQYSYEINKDSGFVKKTWMINNKYNELKSYYTYYQSDADSMQNHIIYQYSDRDAFNNYRTSLKKSGYKLITEKKKKHKKKKNKTIDKENQEIYLSESTNSLIVIKEVFLLGFNAFLAESYNSKCQFASKILESK